MGALVSAAEQAAQLAHSAVGGLPSAVELPPLGVARFRIGQLARVAGCVALSFGVAACGSGSGGSSGASGVAADNGAGGAPQVPGTAGSFGGTYRVPVSAELAAAATFDVPELTWTVNGTAASLSYDLPRALVGIPLRVDFTGPYDPATGQARLVGAAGTADCTVTATSVSCAETMRGLLPIAGDLAVVAQLAATYPGPPSDRASVATQVMGDPIGIALIDLGRPGVPEVPEPVEVGSGKKP
jgi:hypothetical protein